MFHSSAPAQADPAEVVAGRYALQRPLGAGTLAMVWRAEDLTTGESVALKLARRSPEHVARRAAVSLAEEARVLDGLDHPGVVTLRDAGEHEERPFVVLDLVPGLPLHRHRDWTPGDVARVGAEVADALSAVHDAGLVHGDVSPANVVLDAEERPRLLDFSTARPPGTRPRAAADEVVGTPPFLAPEQVRGVLCTAASDVWSLGLVLLECVTGRREYPGPALDAAVARLRRPPHVPSDLPPALRVPLRAALDEDPAGRPSARGLADRLASCALASGATLPPLDDGEDDPLLSTAALAVPSGAAA